MACPVRTWSCEKYTIHVVHLYFGIGVVCTYQKNMLCYNLLIDPVQSVDLCSCCLWIISLCQVSTLCACIQERVCAHTYQCNHTCIIRNWNYEDHLLLMCVCVFFPLSVGEKFLIRWYRGYLISVTVGGRVGGRASLSASQSGSSDAMTLTIYDITNQFIGEGISTEFKHNF